MSTLTSVASCIIMGEENNLQQRRSRAVKTAWLLAIIAGLIFVAFVLSGVLGKPV